MNLSIATLLAKRFLSDVVENGLLNKLTLVLDAAKSEDPDVFKVTVQDAYAAVKESLFQDKGLRIFPEFQQLGLGEILDADHLKKIEKLSENGIGKDSKLSKDEKTQTMQIISEESNKLKALSKELQKLRSLADYFNVKVEKQPEAPAIAAFKFLEDDRNGNVDGFIGQMQIFQKLLSYCEAGTNIEANNIRMISGDKPVILADMSYKGGLRMQAIVDLVRQTRLAFEKVGEAEKNLADFNVRDSLLRALKEEANLIKVFKAERAEKFLSESFSPQEKESVRKLAGDLLSLFNRGGAIDAVILQENAAEEEPSIDLLVEDAEALEFEQKDDLEKEKDEETSLDRSDAPKDHNMIKHSISDLHEENNIKKSDEQTIVTRSHQPSSSSLRSLWKTLLKK